MLGNKCSTQVWDLDVNVLVCRLYKALFAFTVVAMLSMAGEVVLDFGVRRKETSRGNYNRMQGDQVGLTSGAGRGNAGARGYNEGEEAWRTSIGDGLEEEARPFRPNGPGGDGRIGAAQFGHEAPSQQTGYGYVNHRGHDEF